MSNDNGYNPMQWNCKTQGCFNLKKRPKIEVFSACLPGKMAFSNIGAATERNGNLLIIQWNSANLPELCPQEAL